MWRILFLLLFVFNGIVSYSQNNYDMIIDTKYGKKITIPTTEINEVFFKRESENIGNDDIKMKELINAFDGGG